MRSDQEPVESSALPVPSSETVALDEVLEAALEECEGDGVCVSRRTQEDSLLQTFIFTGLTKLSTPWDSAKIAHFNADDFLVVLARCADAGVQVVGIEVFTPEGKALAVTVPGGDADLSHLAFVQRFLGRNGLNICATYRFHTVSQCCKNPTLLD